MTMATTTTPIAQDDDSPNMLREEEEGKEGEGEYMEGEEEVEGSGYAVAVAAQSQWRRRGARSIDEGIRTERSTGATAEEDLSSLLLLSDHDDRSFDNRERDGGGGRDGGADGIGGSRRRRGRKSPGRQYAARTIAGLLAALAEESRGLEVKVDARDDTPLWGKRVDTVHINFNRLGFKPLQMGGTTDNDVALVSEAKAGAAEEERSSPSSTSSSSFSREEDRARRLPSPWVLAGEMARTFSSSSFSSGGYFRPPTADEAFRTIDADGSGTLDERELAAALSLAAGVGEGFGAATASAVRRSKETLSGLASRLVRLYDVNGDGVVDREEYQVMVEEMAALSEAQRIEREEEERRAEKQGGWRGVLTRAVGAAVGRLGLRKGKEVTVISDDIDIIKGPGGKANGTKNGKKANGSVVVRDVVKKKNGVSIPAEINGGRIDFTSAIDVTQEVNAGRMMQGEGSIVLSDLKLDLRRLIFGGVPLVKRVSACQEVGVMRRLSVFSL